jgi:hypothetical protein
MFVATKNSLNGKQEYRHRDFSTGIQVGGAQTGKSIGDAIQCVTETDKSPKSQGLQQ